MSSKNEKKRKKQIQKELAQKEKDSFFTNLPLARELLNELFDDLNAKLEGTGCKHDYEMTSIFLNLKGKKLDQRTIIWFQENGGYCDCEILFNVADKFE